MPKTYPARTVDAITRDDIDTLLLVPLADGTWRTFTSGVLRDTDGAAVETFSQTELHVTDPATIAQVDALVDQVHRPKLEAELGVSEP